MIPFNNEGRNTKQFVLILICFILLPYPAGVILQANCTLKAQRNIKGSTDRNFFIEMGKIEYFAVILVLIDLNVCKLDKVYEITEEDMFRIEHDEYFKDLWGYKVNWRDLKDGWNDEKRALILAAEKDMLEQRQSVPKITENGYEMMKIPLDLYQKILEVKANVSTSVVPELCDVPNYEDNCYEILTYEGHQIASIMFPKSNQMYIID